MGHHGIVPSLVVLNGPPAVGKSTIARLYADAHPMALRLDIDEIRDQLDEWPASPQAAGLRARSLATAMAREHLVGGYDVVVAQLYGRPDHLVELEALASEVGASYHEIVLMTDAETTLDRFERRGGPRLDETLDAPDGLATIAALHDRVAALSRERPQAIIVESIPGDVPATYEAVLVAIGRAG